MTDSEKEYLIEVLREQKLSFEQEYYKSLLNLSAAALALSISVVQIFIEVQYTNIGFLQASWISLIMAVTFILLYFIWTPYHIDRRIKQIKLQGNINAQNDEELDRLAEETDYKSKNKRLRGWWAYSGDSVLFKSYKLWGYCCTLFFIIGIISLSIFTFANIIR